MKILLTIVLSFSSLNLLASGGGGGGSNYGSGSKYTNAIKSAKKAASGSSAMNLVKSLNGDQKKQLMDAIKNPKSLETLKSLLK